MNARGSYFRTATVGIILCCLGILLTGCFISSEEYNGQSSWVDQMNNTFTDDHFEYGGPAFDPIGGQSPAMAIVRSENFPQEEISLLDTEEGLFTNYNVILYRSEAEEYFTDYFSGKFECDECEVKYWNQNDDATPIQSMSANEYIRDYVDLNKAKVVIYRKDGMFPDEHDMQDILIGICKDRDEICNFTLYFCKEKTTMEEAANTCECYFDLYMDAAHSIRYICYKYKDDNNRSYLVSDYSW